MSTDKKELRERILAHRHALLPDDWQARSKAICEHLAHDLDIAQTYRRIALYKSFRNEVDVSPLMKLLLHKDYYFPKTNLRSRAMEFLRFDPHIPFAKNRWGVDEPTTGEALINDAETLIVVPALAYDKRGHRLGYGKGFYDQFLSSFAAATIGVCFSEFFLESLPSEAHDRVVNRVVTEHGFIGCHRS